MTDQPLHGTAAPRDQLPLLPRGIGVFERLPLSAINVEALAPAIGDGVLVVHSHDQAAVVLLRDGTITETHALRAGRPIGGEAALDEVRKWPDGEVSAYRLEGALVELAAALMRGDPLYDNLRLEWTDWNRLLADLNRRGETYVIELTTPHGRGVTCLTPGRQPFSYTDIHPDLGDIALLEAMAAPGDGTVRVRQVRSGSLLSALGALSPASAEAAPHAPAPLPAAAPPETHEEHQVSGWTTRPLGTDPASAAEPPAPVPAPHPDLSWVSPWRPQWSVPGAGGEEAPVPPTEVPGVPPPVVMATLREVARRRLQLSAGRVETLLEEATVHRWPIDQVLAEVRALSIRGVMQSTIDQMADEMAEVAAQHH